MVKVHKIHFKDNPELDYEVRVGSDLLSSVKGYILDNISDKKQAILTDNNVVRKGHLALLNPSGWIPTFIIEPDEDHGVECKKNVDTYGEIINFLDSRGFEKNDVLICLGGGVVGDIGGFVAGTYKRGGMTYVQVPTTTLSQADSCVGGKCAVDSRTSKNAAGCFYQPHLVFSDISTLLTLDDRNFRSGLVESVKHGLILDEEYFSFLEQNIDDILKRDVGLLEEIALKNVQLKGSVVSQDPNEKNYRKSLNFGHTIGHAVEIASGFSLYHGEAVALGILAALDISHSLGSITSNACKDVEKLLSKLGMPNNVPGYIDRRVVEERLTNDKKSVDGIPHFVRIEGIGKLHTENGLYASPIPKQALSDALDCIFK
jgi:3-dehydroquinate synthase